MEIIQPNISPSIEGAELSTLAESADLECKAAQGRDGRGELPDDFWRTYSAMANGEGGVVLLGVQEKPRGSFKPIGLPDLERVRKSLWDNLHNRKQISANLLAERDVFPFDIAGVTVLRINIPRASRHSKPVHIGSNPLSGTYLRRYEGDYAADEETVRRMLAERVEDSRDERVIRGFDFSDLDQETVAAYRNRFAAVRPGHVWSDLPMAEFLERIGAWGKNREENFSGLRLAGLLMFGRAEVIRDALPHYMVDYQERPEAKAEKRWIDRIVPDGSWSGNVYDFFRRVYQKLTADLKVPFQLVDGQRVDDTPVHEALREALTNTLIHADFSGRVSVLVVKRPDMFGFRNPGLMRMPPEVAVMGGNSDCRNRRLQTMFQLVGYGDHAGSGLPKIYKNWTGQHWRRPTLYEVREPEQTLMELRMSSLVPPEIVQDLQARLGTRLEELPELGRLALITAATEGIVSNSRLREISAEHPADITKVLGALVKDGLLQQAGTGRGMIYFTPWHASDFFEPTKNQAYPVASGIPIPPEITSIPPQLSVKPPELTEPLELKATYLEWSEVPAELKSALEATAAPVSQKRRANPEAIWTTVQKLCEGRYLGRRVLAHLLARNADDLLKRTLNPMVAAGSLHTAHPSASDPRQAYTKPTAK
jgi:ATP-dependent DNA helicase RecG